VPWTSCWISQWIWGSLASSVLSSWIFAEGFVDVLDDIIVKCSLWGWWVSLGELYVILFIISSAWVCCTTSCYKFLTCHICCVSGGIAAIHNGFTWKMQDCHAFAHMSHKDLTCWQYTDTWAATNALQCGILEYLYPLLDFYLSLSSPLLDVPMQASNPSFHIISDTHYQLSQTAAVYFRAHLTTVWPFFKDSPGMSRALSKSWANSTEHHAALISVFTQNLEFVYPTTGMVHDSSTFLFVIMLTFCPVPSHPLSLLRWIAVHQKGACRQALWFAICQKQLEQLGLRRPECNHLQ